MKIDNLKKPGLFAAGVLFGTAGIKILTSKDAKKLYTNCFWVVVIILISFLVVAAINIVSGRGMQTRRWI